MEGRKIPLSALIGSGEKNDGEFIESKAEVKQEKGDVKNSLLSLFSFLSLNKPEAPKEIKIYETVIEYKSPYKPSEPAYKGSSFEEVIVFRYTDIEDAKKINTIQISKEKVLAALARPKLLSEGKLGVYISKSVIFGKAGYGTDPASIAAGLFSRAVHGSTNIALVFNSQKVLENVRITDTCRDKDYQLITLHNLVSKKPMLIQAEQQKAKESAIAEEREIDKRFNF